MSDYIILTDSSCDLPAELCEELDIEVLPLTVHLDGKTYRNYLDWREIQPAAFYKALRDGKTATTSAVNIDDFLCAFRSYLSTGKDVLYIGFSSALSSTFSSAAAAITLLESELTDFPGRRVLAVDSRSGCLGQGLVVYHAAKARAEGKSIDEVRLLAEELKMRACHWITVSDLHYFSRGGRLSYTSAFVGSVLGIKPLLRVNSQSILEMQSKVRGRKNSISALVDKLQYADDIHNQVIFLGHTGCPIDAAVLAGEVRARFKPKDIIISNVGPVVGSHAGPDALALFFLGERDMP
ncbi:MAG: DegV family protein [Candidatus Heteroscillospira sp.]|jgi:DegV family protein with EDD domain